VRSRACLVAVFTDCKQHIDAIGDGLEDEGSDREDSSLPNDEERLSSYQGNISAVHSQHTGHSSDEGSIPERRRPVNLLYWLFGGRDALGPEYTPADRLSKWWSGFRLKDHLPSF